MERDANYVAVGAFVLLLIAMGVWFLLWYGDAGERREYNMYEINFTGSVGGLDQGSAVRYLGVDVGRVRRLALDRNNPTQVKIIVEIDENAPISAATRANLNMQGITGLLFINLKQAADGDPNAPLPQGERYPRIESVTSDLDDLLASLPDLVARASQLLDHIDTQVFSKANVASISESLANIRDTTKTFPQTAQKISTLADQLSATLAEVNGAAASIRGIAEDARPNIGQTLEQFKVAADNLSGATKRVNDFVASAEVQMGHLSEHGLFEFERLLRDARDAAQEFGDLSRSLKQQPSQLMYERPNSGTEIRP
jgi:phospholipid/cholesterol/gamma-HCH transport system substrate-binding protein